MPESTYQRTAVAQLTTFCERMITRGRLQPEDEMMLRALTNMACEAFDMSRVIQDNVPIDDLEANLTRVAVEMLDG